MIALLAAAFVFQGGADPLPERAYQPRLFDPGLDAGIFRWFQGNGELTPDGRLFLAFRNPAAAPSALFRSALMVGVLRGERMKEDAHGHLDRFYEPPTGGGAFGEEFAFDFASISLECSSSEDAIVHYGYALEPCDSDLGPPCYVVCRPASTPPEFQQGFQLDPDFPLPSEFGNAHFTFALVPTPVGNPYRSNCTGAYAANGAYLTYRIWLVRTHSRGYEDGVLLCKTGPGELLTPDPNRPPCPPCSPGGQPCTATDPILVSQTITVVVKENAAPPHSLSIVYAALDPETYVPLTSGANTIGAIEPTMTEDGRLILFHGNGSTSPFCAGNANVTYIMNAVPCSPTGWSTPRSITELPPPGELSITLDEFKQRYQLFANPIRMPPVSTGLYSAGYTFPSGATVRGTYPWVSKDGSFFIATCATASESLEGSGCASSNRARAGGYVCGAITGGYIKHIDDVGINPTRRGGPWHWPSYQDHGSGSCPPHNQNSWRSFTFATGLKPGPWEPLFGQRALIPTQEASQRIPILSVFESEIDTYGEVRFEEADGNYLLYLACNESLRLGETFPGGGAALPGETDALFDARATPDTSGRGTRALSVLNDGAAFPQEVLGSSATLRQRIGDRLNDFRPLHENVGFKGQAIVFNAEGNVRTSGAPGLATRTVFTVQAFVKVLSTPASTLTLFESGMASGGNDDPLVTLKLDPSGRFLATVSVSKNSTRVELQATSRANALPFGQDLYDPRLGWRHVAVLYDGDAPQGNPYYTGGKSSVSIYLDGLLDQNTGSLGASTVWPSSGTAYYLVGPGRTATSAVNDANKALVLDEVAVSDLLRSTEELRRDAYVVPEAPAFVAWPGSAPALPSHLDPADAKWPAGVTYSQAIADLGAQLFCSELLSAPSLYPDLRSCSTCHVPGSFASPGQARAEDVDGNDLPFNTPTLLDAAFGSRKFFDGRAPSIEEQVLSPITSGAEMGAQSMLSVLNRLKADSAMLAAFGAAFPGPNPVTKTNLKTALAMYLRTLWPGPSSFDTGLVPHSLAGQGQALFFGKAGCFSCHRGSTFQDDDFHNILSVPVAGDFDGRFDATGRIADQGRVKTPTLRNILQTGPYFHDGSKLDLAAVVQHYNDPPFDDPTLLGVPDLQLRPLFLIQSERNALVAFLEALSGSEPADPCD